MTRPPLRIVLTTWGSFGDLHPYMALALELQRRGHRPAIATSALYREKVESAGLAFYPVRPDLPPIEEAGDMLRRILDPLEGPRYIFETLIASNLREMYADTMAAARAEGGADLLVSHPITLATPLVAARAGIRWVSTVLAPISFFSAWDPPSPPYGPAARRILAWHPAVARAAVRLGKSMTRSWVRPVARLRRELALPPGRHPLFEGQHSPVLVLALFSEVFGPKQPDFPPHTRITGFPFYDADAPNLPPGLARFLDEGEPPILFTLGSSAVWIAGDFHRISAEAARRLGRRALLLTGERSGAPAREPPLDLPPGSAAFGYAPYSAVMPRARVIVHQGGVGTTAQALRAGRPTLIMPFGHDTSDNARRTVELGVGRMLPQKRYTVERVAAVLAELLARPAYAARAAAVAARIRAEDGVGAACDALESSGTETEPRVRSPSPN